MPTAIMTHANDTSKVQWNVFLIKRDYAATVCFHCRSDGRLLCLYKCGLQNEVYLGLLENRLIFLKVNWEWGRNYSVRRTFGLCGRDQATKNLQAKMGYDTVVNYFTSMIGNRVIIRRVLSEFTWIERSRGVSNNKQRESTIMPYSVMNTALSIPDSWFGNIRLVVWSS